MHTRIRPAAASDAPSIHKLLEPYARKGIILARSREEILQELEKFFVACHGSDIIGVVSFYDYGKRLKEIRSLAVKRKFSGTGIGSSLVAHLLKALYRDYPDTRIFALTYAPGFFKKLDFVEVPKESLPEKIWKDCDHCAHREECNETALIHTRS